jgi:ubiquinone/menaquinone biosynthesis C-methylase UbiE
MSSRVPKSIRNAIQGILSPMPRSMDAELLDEDVHDPIELAENFRDIRRVNSLLGGTSTVLELLPRLTKNVADGQSTTILDLGTGCADIPLAISSWAARRGFPVQIVASDYADDILALARKRVGDQPHITMERYDARSVPLPDKTFDIVLCSLTLHHFPEDEAVQILREMDRLARTGFILNDLRRSRAGYAAAWIAARLTTRNRLTRNDAPLSVRRAYTPGELQQLLRRAGIDHAEISRRLWFRMAAVVAKRGTT